MPERREGDWDCPECGALNFARRDTCFKCGAESPAAGEDGSQKASEENGREGGSQKRAREEKRRDGDWDCPECGALNFAGREQCFKCGAEPEGRSQKRAKKSRKKNKGATRKRREGDWDCPSCGALNFSRRDDCFKCGAERPPDLENEHPDVDADEDEDERPDADEDEEGFDAAEGDAAAEQESDHDGDAHWQQEEPSPDKRGTRQGGPPWTRQSKRSLPERREGDWDCSNCDTLNFAYRENCVKCGMARHKEEPRRGERRHERREFRPHDGAGERQHERPEFRPHDAAGERHRERREGDWDCSECGAHNFANRENCFKCGTPKRREEPRQDERHRERREGDWDCSKCGAHNFANRENCFQCGAQKRREEPRQDERHRERREGDWDCFECGAHNFANRENCFKCGAPKRREEPRQGERNRERREGDWDCSECGAHNFANRENCFKCGAPKHREEPRQGERHRERREGDWDCPGCGAHNFAGRDACFKCGRPKFSETQREGSSEGPPASSAGATSRDVTRASDAIKFLAKVSPNFKKSWVSYCRTTDQGSSDPSKREESFILEFVNYAADLLQEDLGGKASGADAADKKTVSVRRGVAERMRKLISKGGRLAQLRPGAVAISLSRLSEADALEVLSLLEEQQAEVDDPNEFVRLQAEYFSA